jgi:hypothetical protein
MLGAIFEGGAEWRMRPRTNSNTVDTGMPTTPEGSRSARRFVERSLFGRCSNCSAGTAVAPDRSNAALSRELICGERAYADAGLRGLTISSKCRRAVGAARRFFSGLAIRGPNLMVQNRIVS